MGKNISRKALVIVSFIFLIIFLIIFTNYSRVFLSPSPLDEGIVSLTFDDGLKTQYENAFHLMQEYNMTGTLYPDIRRVKADSWGGRKTVSIENVMEMYESGWEIGSHSVNHKRLDELEKEELKYELEYPVEFFKGYGINVSTLAYPYGYYDEKVLEEARNFYIAGRVIDEKGKDFYNLRGDTEWLTKDHSAEDICKKVERADERDEWLILLFHSVEEEKRRTFDTSIEVLQGILECIDDVGIDVKNVDEVVLGLMEA